MRGSKDPIRLGHWTDERRRTGCSVILFDELTPAVVDIRGGAPGTRETDLLRPGSLVGAVDAILLTGGSAFGLAAADGVMRFLRENGRGMLTTGGGVPIVSAAVLFDLAPGDLVAPDAASGHAACVTSEPLPPSFAGRVGAGAGATFQKMWGPAHVRPGGIGVSTVSAPSGSVTAVLALNAVGALRAAEVASGTETACTREELLSIPFSSSGREATTIGAVIVEGASDRDLLARCAIAAHDGLARMIVPAHTIHDGDVFWAVGPDAGVPDDAARVQTPIVAELAVEQAIRAIAMLSPHS
ncbi:MAG: P1 family peptidase [Thermomicrobiales bacterium]